MKTMIDMPYTIDDLFNPGSPFHNGAPVFLNAPAAQNAHTQAINPGAIASGELLQQVTVGDGFIQSQNYASGSTGWKLTPTGGDLGVAVLNIAARGWSQTSAFSVTDADTVAWGAGTFTSADGTAYSISGGNTGNMVAKTYIYLDTAVSTTAYQTTTTAANAVGSGKVLIATAQNGTGEAVFFVLEGQGGQNIDASSIVANSITANELATSITYTGTLIIGTGGAARSGQTAYNTGTGWWIGDDGGTAKFSIGSPTGSRVTWDGSTLSIVGNASNSKIFTIGESVTAGQSVLPLFYPANDVSYNAHQDWEQQNIQTGSPFTESGFTVASGSDRFMIVVTTFDSLNTDAGADGARNITGVTWNGTALTQVDLTAFDSNNGNYGSLTGQRMEVWKLDDPATGNNNLVFSTDHTTLTTFRYVVYVFNNVNTVSLIAADSNTSGSPGTIALSAYPSINKSVVFGVGRGTRTSDDVTDNNEETDASGEFAGWSGPIHPTRYMSLNLSSAGNAAAILEVTPITTSSTQRIYLTDADIPERTNGAIGFMLENGSAGDSKAVTVNGIASGLSSITVGGQYYVSNTPGAIGTSPGTNSRKIAVGVSDTEVVITNIW